MKFYHGGGPGFQAGDLLEPEPDSDAVYFTENRLYAKFFASLGRGWLYLVEPIGDYSPATDDAMQSCVPIKVISERLGHESPSFTMKQYAHVLPTMQAEAASLIASVVLRTRS